MYIPHNAVLVFDDLERCDCPINEVFGFLNELVEHEKTKVILKLISENSEKVLSYWLLDETHTSKKDIEMISKDFSETIFGNDKVIIKKPNKKNLKDLERDFR